MFGTIAHLSYYVNRNCGISWKKFFQPYFPPLNARGKHDQGLGAVKALELIDKLIQLIRGAEHPLKDHGIIPGHAVTFDNVRAAADIGVKLLFVRRSHFQIDKGLRVIIGADTDIPAPDVNTNSQTMTWVLDTYSQLAGKPCPGVVTGKPVELGGSKGRNSATGRGVYISTKLLMEKEGKPLESVSVAIQGMGNVGSNAARIFYHRNIRVVAVSDISGGLYCADGLDIDAISEYLSVKGNLLIDYNASGITHITNAELLTCTCDVLIPAALENQINAEVAEKVQCSYIVEAANGPTTAAGDKVLERRGIPVIPDIFANCGGVIVSYFEWVQNIQELTWERDQVNQMLSDLMTKSFREIVSVAEECSCTYRMAAYIVALRKLIYAEEIKGIFP